MDSVPAHETQFATVPGHSLHLTAMDELTVCRLLMEYKALYSAYYEMSHNRSDVDPVEEIESDRRMLAYYKTKQAELQIERERQKTESGTVAS